MTTRTTAPITPRLAQVTILVNRIEQDLGCPIQSVTLGSMGVNLHPAVPSQFKELAARLGLTDHRVYDADRDEFHTWTGDVDGLTVTVFGPRESEVAA